MTVILRVSIGPGRDFCSTTIGLLGVAAQDSVSHIIKIIAPVCPRIRSNSKVKGTRTLRVIRWNNPRSAGGPSTSGLPICGFAHDYAVSVSCHNSVWCHNNKMAIVPVELIIDIRIDLV